MILLVRPVDRLHDFRSGSRAHLGHTGRCHCHEVADQPQKQAIRNQRLFLQGHVCLTIPIATFVRDLRLNNANK
jgi:hypothetical protein